jgi:lactate dehydrogenase-like 2-hydroxyacid dehydrogenase
VIGTGKIGSALINLLRSFGCRILAHDLYHNPLIEEFVDYTDLDTLYSQSDIISLHMPATADNYHAINKTTLAKMKSGVCIVNTARGTLIDSQALIEALESQHLAAVALDVFEDESEFFYQNLSGKVLPLRDLYILKSMPNVIMTPHIAFYTRQALLETVHNAIESCVLEISNKKNHLKIV